MYLWEEWFNLAKKGVFTLQTCKDCSIQQFYPRSFCLECNEDNLELEKIDGVGKIYSYTEIFRSPNPEKFTTPYIVGLVELNHKIKIICQLDLDTDNVSIDKEVKFKEVNNEGVIVFQ